MKNVVLQYNGVFIAGFSYKTQRVYKVAEPHAAKRFTADEAQKFIVEHSHKENGLRTENITIHILKRGQLFDPFHNGGHRGQMS